MSKKLRVLLMLAVAGLALAQEPAPPADGIGSSFKLFPVGKDWQDVRVPRFKEDRTLDMMIHADTVRRESDEILELDEMTVVMFEKDRSMSLRVKTKKGVYSLSEKVMKSRDKTFIASPQFDMEGERLEFNTETQSGILNGNVKMVIYNVESATAPPPTSPEASEEPLQP